MYLVQQYIWLIEQPSKADPFAVPRHIELYNLWSVIVYLKNLKLNFIFYNVIE